MSSPNLLYPGDVIALNVAADLHSHICPIFLAADQAAVDEPNISAVCFQSGFGMSTPDSVHDPRDFLFKFVPRLNYAASKDLRKTLRQFGHEAAGHHHAPGAAGAADLRF